MKRFVLILLVLVLGLSGCGYHTPQKGDDWVGGEAHVIYVELFANRTTEPYLENYITEQVVFQLSRSRMVTITEDRASADAVLTGTVEHFKSGVIAYDSSDRITEYRAKITVMASLTRVQDDHLLWKSRLTSSEDFPATLDKNLQLEGQDLAAREVSRRLGEDLYAQMFNAF